MALCPFAAQSGASEFGARQSQTPFRAEKPGLLIILVPLPLPDPTAEVHRGLHLNASRGLSRLRAPQSRVPKNRGVAQPGRALRSGRRSRRFKSFHPDQFKFPATNDCCLILTGADRTNHVSRRLQCLVIMPHEQGFISRYRFARHDPGSKDAWNCTKELTSGFVRVLHRPRFLWGRWRRG